MPTLARFVALLAVPALALCGGAGAPKAGAVSCGGAGGVRCLTVRVPLDRDGRVPGTVPLHVEVLPAAGRPRGVMLLLAGGPGDAAARAFELGTEREAPYWRRLAPGYTLVAYDIRGTGRSGALGCPMLRGAYGAEQVGACGRSLGPRRDFYGTADHVEDLEAVRRALGAKRIALYGVSYGTKLALAYAAAHPEYVERLLLDSVVSPWSDLGSYVELAPGLPGTLRRLCADGACRAATPDFSADAVTVANALAAKPIHGTVLRPDGSRRPVRVDGLTFFSLCSTPATPGSRRSCRR